MNSLSLAAFLILCFNPTYLFDIGFQLSFLSVLSILLIYPIIFRKVSLKKGKYFTLNRYFIQPMLFSFSIWIGIGVLIAYYFQIVSPIMVLANFFVVPCLVVIVALGAGLLLTGLVWPWAAEAFAICLKIMINSIMGGTYLLSQIPGSYFYVRSFSFLWVWIYYVLLILGLIIFNVNRIRQNTDKNVI